MKSVETKIAEVLLESAELYMERLDETSKHATESPIERLMLHALCSRGVWQDKLEFCWWTHGQYSHEMIMRDVRGAFADDPFSCRRGQLIQQMRVGPYRADFGIASITSDDRVLVVAIECDGHDFHEKSKDQVARDKARDRYFTENDIRLFRFSGAEIWRDAGSCADQVINFISDWMMYPALVKVAYLSNAGADA